MLTIKNYKKIRHQHFGDWQCASISEVDRDYAFKFVNKNGNIAYVIVDRTPRFDLDEEHPEELTYEITISIDTSTDIITDFIYGASLSPMEFFGECVKQYLDNI